MLAAILILMSMMILKMINMMITWTKNDFDDGDYDDHLDGEVARLLWTSSASVIFPTYVQRDDDHSNSHDDDGDDFV